MRGGHGLYCTGWASPVFTISAVVAIVVMYDAANVRKGGGEQAKILQLYHGTLD